MIQNYLKMAWRNLMKHRFISFINLFGLAMGLACCLLISIYIIHETSFDRYHNKADRIYRVTRNFNNPDGAVTLRLSTIAPPFGPLLKNDFPDIQQVTRLLPNGKTPVKYGEKLFSETQLFFADEHLFDVFDVNVTKGNPEKALQDPFTVMVSEKIARKYFGNEEAMNKIIKINNQFNLKVTGVFRSFPSNSHIHPEIMVSFNTLKDSAVYGETQLRTNYGNNSFFTYFLVPENYPVKNIEAQFPAFIDKHMFFPGAPPATKFSRLTSLGLQKLTDIHLYSHTDYEAEENGDITRVYIFAVIALVILLIACINYMNLATARSALRAKEIGIRKVAGAGKGELIAQFLSESVLIAWIAMALAILIAWIVLPWINRLSGLTLTGRMLLDWRFIVPIILVPFIVGITSGIYPALFMSSFQPVKTLKGLFRTGGRSLSFRQALVVTQFGISIVLIITTAIVFQQLRYMQKAKLGYQKEQVLALPYYFTSNSQYEAFRNDILNQPHIQTIGRSSRIPTGRLLDSQNAAAESGDSLQPVNVELKYLAIDQDFIPSYGISMAAGRNFSKAIITDTANFLLNETAVKVLGWPSAEKSIGRNFSYGGTRGKVVGVVQDFHFESLRQRIAPMVLSMPNPALPNFYNALSVKIAGDNTTEAVASIEKKWKTYLPEIPFEFSFVDDSYNKLYQAEQRQGRLFTIFAGIAILIACLGLLGLSSFAITQRIKEIGVRKVLGAGTASIVLLLSRDFMKLVFLAALIAFPVAWYALNLWLTDFAYRIPVSWWIFVAAGSIAAAIALLTVSILAIRAATANPVKSLRTE